MLRFAAQCSSRPFHLLDERVRFGWEAKKKKVATHEDVDHDDSDG